MMKLMLFLIGLSWPLDTLAKFVHENGNRSNGFEPMKTNFKNAQQQNISHNEFPWRPIGVVNPPGMLGYVNTNIKKLFVYHSIYTLFYLVQFTYGNSAVL